MKTNRRSFILSAFASAPVLFLPGRALAALGKPLLRFGVVSDVHIGGCKTVSQRLETVLRWLAARDVDAVTFPGDVTHSGLISEFGRFAVIWYKVFPDGRGRDERKVEIMISTGNYDVAASWVKGTDEWRTQIQRGRAPARLVASGCKRRRAAEMTNVRGDMI